MLTLNEIQNQSILDIDSISVKCLPQTNICRASLFAGFTAIFVLENSCNIHGNDSRVNYKHNLPLTVTDDKCVHFQLHKGSLHAISL